MRTSEKVSAGDRHSSMEPRERLMLVIAFVGIAIWGFTGSWEYPTVETSVPATGDRGTSMLDDPQTAATPGGAVVTGAQLFQANGCYACHSLDGERKIGPSLRGIFGETVELDNGSTVLVDDNYVIESILQPEAKRVAGYDDAAMPSYEGIVSAEDASALAEYIKGIE